MLPLGLTFKMLSCNCLLKGLKVRKFVTQTAGGSRPVINRSACQNEAVDKCQQGVTFEMMTLLIADPVIIATPFNNE